MSPHTRKLPFFTCFIISICIAGPVSTQIADSADKIVINARGLHNAHIGISIYEPATNTYWYNYQGDKYFVPASNTKIPTCYAAMKYLGDSLVGLRYGFAEQWQKEKILFIKSSGDPTFLHKDFAEQPVFDFLKSNCNGKKYLGYYIDSVQVDRWGAGWSWNDYMGDYMAERNVFPVFGNVLNIQLNDVNKRSPTYEQQMEGNKLILFTTGNHFFDSIINDNNTIQNIKRAPYQPKEIYLSLARSMENNYFYIKRTTKPFVREVIPFSTGEFRTTLDVLKDTLSIPLAYLMKDKNDKYFWESDISYDEGGECEVKKWYVVHSQPTDSVLKPMMHRSDNFFAEQMLLMVSNEKLGYMNDEAIIDTLLNNDLKDLPQKPNWADGSGLSRYNLFTPQDMVFILNKMKDEFGMDRVKDIFATGGTGTISNYYKADSGFIYGKTGSLSGVVAFSGFLYTKQGKLLIFSTLVNNHVGSATEVRRAVERFLEGVRNNY